jgi:hypothetical protein
MKKAEGEWRSHTSHIQIISYASHRTTSRRRFYPAHKIIATFQAREGEDERKSISSHTLLYDYCTDLTNDYARVDVLAGNGEPRGDGECLCRPYCNSVRAHVSLSSSSTVNSAVHVVGREFHHSTVVCSGHWCCASTETGSSSHRGLQVLFTRI